MDERAAGERERNGREVDAWRRRLLSMHDRDYAGAALDEAFEALRLGLGLFPGEMPEIVWTTNSSLRITSAGGAGLEVLDVVWSQLIGRGLFECFQSGNVKATAVAAHRQALKGIPSRFEIMWTGSAYDGLVHPLGAPNGTIVGTVGAALDVTEGQWNSLVRPMR